MKRLLASLLFVVGCSGSSSTPLPAVVTHDDASTPVGTPDDDAGAPSPAADAGSPPPADHDAGEAVDAGTSPGTDAGEADAGQAPVDAGPFADSGFSSSGAGYGAFAGCTEDTLVTANDCSLAEYCPTPGCTGMTCAGLPGPVPAPGCRATVTPGDFCCPWTP